MIRSDGGRPIRVAANIASNTTPNWSRDGKWIYFGSTRTGRSETWKVRPDGTSENQITTDGGYSGVESPDGKYLYCKTEPNVATPLWKKPMGGGAPSKVIDSVLGRLVTVTEKGIYFRAPNLDFQFLDFANGKVRLVASLGNMVGAELSPDGRWALTTRPEVSSTNLML